MITYISPRPFTIWVYTFWVTNDTSYTYNLEYICMAHLDYLRRQSLCKFNPPIPKRNMGPVVNFEMDCDSVKMSNGDYLACSCGFAIEPYDAGDRDTPPTSAIAQLVEVWYEPLGIWVPLDKIANVEDLEDNAAREHNPNVSRPWGH